MVCRGFRLLGASSFNNMPPRGSPPLSPLCIPLLSGPPISVPCSPTRHLPPCRHFLLQIHATQDTFIALVFRNTVSVLCNLRLVILCTLNSLSHVVRDWQKEVSILPKLSSMLVEKSMSFVTFAKGDVVFSLQV